MRRTLRRRWRRLRYHVVRRKWPLLTLTVAIGGGAAALYLMWPENVDPGAGAVDRRAGSVALASGTVRAASRVLDAYEIIYRVETGSADDLSVSTERLSVRRPFEARTEQLTGPPPGRRTTGTFVYGLNRVKTDRATLPGPPGAPGPDWRPEAKMLREAEEAGFVDVRERRRVAGRTCRVFRFEGDAGGGLVAVAKIRDTYTDMCIDEAGLVLEQVTVNEGEPLSRRLAVKIDEDPEFDDDLFRTGEPTVDARTGGATRRMADDSRPPGATFWELERPPDGFEHAGRYTIVPPSQPSGANQQAAPRYAAVSDVWVNGPFVFVVEQGGSLDQAAPFEEDPESVKVRLGRLGSGELFHGLQSSIIRVHTGQGRFVRVVGTIPPSELLRIARNLEPVEGGELTYEDEG